MGLLGLGYQIKVVIEVHSKVWHTPSITVSVDECSCGSATVVRPSCFIQVKGTSRDNVVSVGNILKVGEKGEYQTRLDIKFTSHT